MALRTWSVVGLGEVLWDVYDDKRFFGGAPANFACHAQSLGAGSTIVSAVGCDELGREAIAWMQSRALSIDYVTEDPVHPTGSVRVRLDAAGRPEYRFAADVAWDHLHCSERWLRLAEKTDAVCFGTLAQRCSASQRAIGQFLDAVPKHCLRVFDVNLRQNFYSDDVIRTSLARCDVLKLNEDEWTVVARAGLEGWLEPVASDSDEAAMQSAMEQLVETYGLRCVALTLGARGSMVWAEGVWDRQVPQAIEVVDTVGAGDAFSAALILGWLNGMPLARMHARASRVAAYVCTQRGAVPALPPAWAEA
jgi:fructokinase